MKRFTFVMVFLMLGLVSFVSADEDLGVVANLNTGCIQFIDPMTQTLSDPLLKSELGSYTGGLLDVAITSDGKTALVSNFGDSRVFFIDISGGFNGTPKVLGFARTRILAEDIAITPDDKYAMVTDGAFSRVITVIEIATRRVVIAKNIGPRSAQAIAITPDGQMVLVVDYFGGAIHTYMLDSDGFLTYYKSTFLLPDWPINIAVSPDGKTVIVPDAFRSIALTYLIDSQYNLCFKGRIPLPSKSGQSCVFSKDSTKAYYLSNNINGTQVHILDVTGPGIVSASGTSITVRPMRGTGQLFGVDTLALDPSGNYLYVTNPNGVVTAGIAVIDLTANIQVDSLAATGYPTGIAFTTITSNGEE